MAAFLKGKNKCLIKIETGNAVGRLILKLKRLPMKMVGLLNFQRSPTVYLTVG
nr:MAG TPA: hypothetical protein [Caudoviricetes sp.]